MAGILRWGFCNPSTATHFLHDLGQTGQCLGKKVVGDTSCSAGCCGIDGGTIHIRYKRELTCRVDAVDVLYKPVLQTCFVLWLIYLHVSMQGYRC